MQIIYSIYFVRIFSFSLLHFLIHPFFRAHTQRHCDRSLSPLNSTGREIVRRVPQIVHPAAEKFQTDRFTASSGALTCIMRYRASRFAEYSRLVDVDITYGGSAGVGIFRGASFTESTSSTSVLYVPTYAVADIHMHALMPC